MVQGYSQRTPFPLPLPVSRYLHVISAAPTLGGNASLPQIYSSSVFALLLQETWREGQRQLMDMEAQTVWVGDCY